MESPKKENRQRVANIVLADKKLFKHLFMVTFKVDDTIFIKLLGFFRVDLYASSIRLDASFFR
jgi:hypothetical protein